MMLKNVLCHRLFGRHQERDVEVRFLAAVVKLALPILFMVYVGKIASTLYFDWNANRLALTLSLNRGYQLYYGLTEGPISISFFGPVATLIYLPASLVSSPTVAIIVGGVITVSLTLAPLLLLCRGVVSDDSRQRVLAVAAFVFSASVLLLVDATREIVTSIHADAPAVGLGLLSCLLLMDKRKQPGSSRIALSGLFAVAAMFSKHNEAPLVLAQLLYVAVVYGRRSVFRFLISVLVSLSLLGGLFVIVYGFDNMLFNMITFPMMRPWQGGVREYVLALRDLTLKQALFALIMYWSVLPCKLDSSVTWSSIRAWVRGNTWVLPALVAISLMPGSALVVMKLGSIGNNYHSIYYLVAACALAVLQSAVQSADTFLRKRASQLLCVLVCASLALTVIEVYSFRQVLSLSRNPEQLAYEFARVHPEEVYFPWNVLPTLMADGKLYHWMDGLIDRERASLRPTEEHLSAYFPSKMRYVVFQPHHDAGIALSFLPLYSHRTTLQELPGWVVYTREPSR